VIIELDLEAACPTEVSVIATPAPVRRFKVVLEWDADDRVWVTYVPSLGLLSTYGDTREEALENSGEAILGYLEAAAKEGISVPPEGDTDVVELEVVTS
jgi:predicted RNase H-like HicB family nuclease